MEGLHDLSEDALGDLSAHVDVVVAISEDLGLDDGDESILLTDCCVSGEGVCGLESCGLGGSALADLDDCSPLGESCALGVVVSASLGKAVKSGGRVLIVGPWDHHESLVDLDAWDDALALEELGEGGAVGGFLVEGLFEEDDSGDVILESLGGEEQLSVGLSVGLYVLNVDLLESLADGASGLVGGKDTEARSDDSSGGLNELLSVVLLLNHSGGGDSYLLGLKLLCNYIKIAASTLRVRSALNKKIQCQ